MMIFVKRICVKLLMTKENGTSDTIELCSSVLFSVRHFFKKIYFPFFVPLSFLLRLSFPFMFWKLWVLWLREKVSLIFSYLSISTSLCYPCCMLIGSACVNDMSISAHLVVYDRVSFCQIPENVALDFNS